MARMALLLAGLPVEVGGLTVNRLCGSGLQAINSAAHAIQVGDGDVFIGGGVESMTRAPYVMAKPATAWERGSHELQDTTLGWRFVNPRLAERIRLRVDGRDRRERRRALADQPRAPGRVRARQPAEGGRGDRGRPLRRPDRAGRGRRPARRGDRSSVTATSIPGPTRSPEALAGLKPAFRDGRHGHRRQQLGDQRRGQRRAPGRGGAGPRARAAGRSPGSSRRRSPASSPASWASARCRPAARPSRGRGSTSADLDLVELNEAFASQSLACIDELGLDPARVNVNGGAIALGHPLGMSGGRLITMLVHELVRTGGRYGLATMCIGVGQGIATVVERIDALTAARYRTGFGGRLVETRCHAYDGCGRTHAARAPSPAPPKEEGTECSRSSRRP